MRISDWSSDVCSSDLFRIRVVEEPMQKRGMGWIDADLQRLQPVAGDMALEGEDMAVGGDKAVEIGESRRFARHVERPEIGAQDAAAQHDGIILLPDALAQPAGFGLGRGTWKSAV